MTSETVVSKTQANARNHSLALFEPEGDNEPVKFVNRAGLDYIQRNGNLAGGYFTLAKWLYGADPVEIEQRLGLRNGEFGGVAYALVFSRLPRFEEFSYMLTAAYPGGKHFPRKTDFDFLHEEKELDKRAVDRSFTPVGSYYPRGDGVIHQWSLLVQLPVGDYVRTITSSMPFARRDGSMGSGEPKLGRLRGVDW